MRNKLQHQNTVALMQNMLQLYLVKHHNNEIVKLIPPVFLRVSELVSLHIKLSYKVYI